MENLVINGYEFIIEDLKTAKIVFTTAKNDFNTNIYKAEGKENLEKIKSWFEINEVGYVNQVHGDNVQIFDGEIHQGDAIITDKPKVAVGVFTADCVPVIIYDIKLKIAAAIHSGWKGTYNEIVSKTIDKMKSIYGSQSESLKVYIGPHMRDCCYQVGEEVSNRFLENEIYKNEDIFKENFLSMEKCILKQLLLHNVPKENVKLLNMCTYCSNEPELYSYRKGEKDKRLFSFIFIK